MSAAATAGTATGNASIAATGNATAALLPEPCMRWFGPNDPVPPAWLRQSGAEGVFTALHQIPYGEVWPREAIRERRELLERAGLRWSVVESVPVHEDIKTGTAGDAALLRNYAETLRNLADEGVRTVIYNFMPALDWMRTDMRHVLPNGAECLHFDPVRLAAFDVFALRRAGAAAEHGTERVARAKTWWDDLTGNERERFVADIIDVFPGCKWGLSLDDIRAMLARYEGVGEDALFANLARFLDAIVPAAERAGVVLAIHPDDPPFPVLGLPRIVSTEEQIARLLAAVPSPANGLCLCTGSLGARADNDLPRMARRFAPRIHAAHLRATRRLPDGSFHEDAHLGGADSVDMPAVAAALLDAQDARNGGAGGAGEEGTGGAWRMPFRSDHGWKILDDLGKPEGVTPGYPCIGRMRGLSELRGLFLGLRHTHGAPTIQSARQCCGATPLQFQKKSGGCAA
ncbi:MAG: mannonate dehydratase [Puniceicoccales bacterium]|jgi:mannonate dehydratase|nr:mannonate dehydratase [Puniceicoccales bacterium]